MIEKDENGIYIAACLALAGSHKIREKSTGIVRSGKI
jgi:hypothetical protein